MHTEEFSREMNALERVLESAVTLSWQDLATSFPPLAMQVEYRRQPDHALEHLKLWSSASRGHWKLVCEYWLHANATHSQGITFTDTYSSAGLTRMLEAIMQNQESFATPHSDFADGSSKLLLRTRLNRSPPNILWSRCWNGLRRELPQEQLLRH